MIRNENDINTADAYLGPTQMGRKLKTITTYTEPGLPKPPAGWNRKLGIYDTESAELSGPDTREGEQ